MTKVNDRQPEIVTINIQNIGTFEVLPGSNLRETLRREGVYLDGTCSDRGVCGRCLVRVIEGEAGEPSSHEKALLGDRAIENGFRLSCQVQVLGDMDVSVDRERILEIDRTGRWKEVWASPLWQPDLLSLDREGYGIAVDMGTTSIAACLIDLASALPLDTRSATNPQLPWGEDIITRLGAANSNQETAGKLRDAVWQAVNDHIRALCRRTGVSKGRIRRMTVVGNSAMHHLCLGLPVDVLLAPPYSPAQKGPVIFSADRFPVRLELAPDTAVYFPPVVGGFAGSDILGALAAVKARETGIGAVLDVGTNTEIAVYSGEDTVVATAPSGPAFEGGHIASGMRAEEGAVWRVRNAGAELEYSVVGDVPPAGICGTGMVDALAVMLSNGSLERSGLPREGVHQSVRDGRLTLDEKGSVFLSGKDVAEIQKAKAAIAATWSLLLNRLGLEAKDLTKVFMAGAFGSRLDPVNAVRIGLLPGLAPERLVMAGNAALVGGVMILSSGKIQEKAEILSEEIVHVNIALEPDFEDTFVENLYFP